MDNLRSRKTGVRGVKRVTVRKSGKVYVYYRHRKTGRNIPGEPHSMQFRRELHALDNDLTGVGSAPPLPWLIYFISSGDAVKIGISQDVARRLESLQCGSPVELTLLGTRPGGEVEERALHQKFAHLRIRGEWFRLERDLLEFINAAQHLT